MSRYSMDELAELRFATAGADASLRFAQDAMVPRPVWLLGTTSPEGIANVAPYSYVTPVATTPASLCISFIRKTDGSDKDTLVNLRASGELVVSAVTEQLVGPANACAENTPPSVSEFERFGLTPLFSGTCRAPHVAESPLRFECRMLSELAVGDGPGSAVLVVLTVERAFVEKSAYAGEGRVNAEALRLVGRCGIDRYLIADDFFAIARPDTGEGIRTT